MGELKPRVVKTEDALRDRVERLLKIPSPSKGTGGQLGLFAEERRDDERVVTPMSTVWNFLSYLSDAVPMGDIYLFGGLLRDVAVFGRKGFKSDVDVVVDGEWAHVKKYIEKMGAKQNRFGGFRMEVAGWPVDLWNARETWAIKEGLVRYDGIASLTRTTILNWDAILMNWRTRQIVCQLEYFHNIQERRLDVVLIENPNPLGAVVRAYRHLCLKDARKITIRAARFLSDSVKRYTINGILNAESLTYRECVIDSAVLKFFEDIDASSEDTIRNGFKGATQIIQPQLL